MKKSLLFASLLLQIPLLFAQTEKFSQRHFLSEQEMSDKIRVTKNFTETPPPTGEIRNIAEWEPAEGVLITYKNGFGIPYEAIAEMSQDCIITTIVSGLSQENTVRTLFINNEVNIANCNFIYTPVDSWWARDYSPWYIAVDNSELAIVDFPYNRDRPNDDEIPNKMATFLGETRYGMDVVQTGGNYMCDGYGVAAQTDLVLDENLAGLDCFQDIPITAEEVNQRTHDYLGISNYFIRPDPLGDYIKHIDCWGKFIAVDKVVVTQVPVSDIRYDAYEAAAAFFSETNCSYGYPYHVFRVQAADQDEYQENPYSNSLILNNKVFVPQTGSAFDDEAIAVYQQAMPGYEIIGSYSSDLWMNTDAFHCRTYGIPDREMLFIKHYPLFGTVNSDNGYSLSTEIYSYAENEIAGNYPKLFYSINGGSLYEDIVMTGSITKSGIYSATIPEQTEGTEIKYYIQALDSEGKSAFHPFIGQADAHIFTAGSNSSSSVSEEKIKVDYFNIYPNPCEGKFFVWVDIEKETTSKLDIYAINGTCVHSENIHLNNGDNLKKIEVGNLKPGIYSIKIQSDKSTLIKKLIVK